MDNMIDYQPIYDIAEICSRKGVRNAVLCPGSRCAPLTIAFTRHPIIEKKTISDERSAAFIALGIAQQSKKPSILVCTSGSAAYNFAPGIAEAFFSQIPLIVFTADRPSEWIGQHDGQTIYQSEIFGKHVKRSFTLPSDYNHSDSRWAINRIVNDAINVSMQEPRGPVHINAPFREPLYPAAEHVIQFSPEVRIIEESTHGFTLSEQQESFLKEDLSSFSNVLVVVGQQDEDKETNSAIERFSRKHHVPIVADIISNAHGVEDVIGHADLFLGSAPDEIKRSLQPDLLITTGKSVISKHLKLFLRKYKPLQHWHFQSNDVSADTFQQLTHTFHVKPSVAFNLLADITRNNEFNNQKQHNFCKLWEVEERRADRVLADFFPQQELAEFEVVKEIIASLPSTCNLHLANSMSVRYANLIGLNTSHKNIRVYVNRGTSGIDGCNSTAVGHCLADNIPNILVTGDMAFFYDRNAFWHNYPLPNLRIVVLNNHGGIIFGMIDGPGSLPEADEYFVTRQKLTATKLCEEYGFQHLALDNRKKIKNLLKDFFDFDGTTKILEIESGQDANRSIYNNFKNKIKSSYEL